MSQTQFIVTSDEAELLLAFEISPTLEKLAEVLGLDISNASRKLSRIAQKLPVVEKKSGRWVLTEQGRKLNQHTRDAIQFQQSLFEKQRILRLGSNREFAARILGPKLLELQKLLPDTHIRITSFEQGTEQALLDGLIDIGFDCERPFSPEIAYKTLVKETIVPVCSPAFKKKFPDAIQRGDLLDLPHLLCDRLFPDKILNFDQNTFNVIASFNDIATARSACEVGIGWALLPEYAVKNELTSKRLTIIKLPDIGKSNYGVWWPRGRKHLEKDVGLLSHWLKRQEL